MKNAETHFHDGKLMNHNFLMLFLWSNKFYGLLGHKLRLKGYRTLLIYAQRCNGLDWAYKIWRCLWTSTKIGQMMPCKCWWKKMKMIWVRLGSWKWMITLLEFRFLFVFCKYDEVVASSCWLMDGRFSHFPFFCWIVH